MFAFSQLPGGHGILPDGRGHRLHNSIILEINSKPYRYSAVQSVTSTSLCHNPVWVAAIQIQQFK